MSRRAGDAGEEGARGVAAPQSRESERDWQENYSAAQTGPPVGGEIGGYDSRRQSDGGGAGLRNVGVGIWAGPAK